MITNPNDIIPHYIEAGQRCFFVLKENGDKKEGYLYQNLFYPIDIKTGERLYEVKEVSSWAIIHEA